MVAGIEECSNSEFTAGPLGLLTTEKRGSSKQISRHVEPIKSM